MFCAKFGRNWSSEFQEKLENVESLLTKGGTENDKKNSPEPSFQMS